MVTVATINAAPMNAVAGNHTSSVPGEAIDTIGLTILEW